MLRCAKPFILHDVSHRTQVRGRASTIHQRLEDFRMVHRKKARSPLLASKQGNDPRLGRLVRVKKGAVARQAQSAYVSEGNDKTHRSLGDDDESSPAWSAGEDDEEFSAIITHVFYDAADNFTGMVDLTLGDFDSWSEALRQLNDTDWARPQGYLAWVAVGELEASGELRYVDGIAHPPWIQPETSEWCLKTKRTCERAMAAEYDHREKEAEISKRQASNALRLAVNKTRQEAKKNSTRKPRVRAKAKDRAVRSSLDAKDAEVMEALIALTDICAIQYHEDLPWEVF